MPSPIKPQNIWQKDQKYNRTLFVCQGQGSRYFGEQKRAQEKENLKERVVV